MAREIERKFLVASGAWKRGARGVRYRQGYLSIDKARVVRVRTHGRRAFLTVKGPTHGISRIEFEYPIPLADAQRMLRDLCHGPMVDKTRYRVRAGGRVWEIDEFHGENAGLVVAEVELDRANAHLDLPAWGGRDGSPQ